MQQNALPAPTEVGSLAVRHHETLTSDPGFERLKESTQKYPDCWGTYTGYPLIGEWDLQRDAGPLFVEAIRVLSLKAAVYDLTGANEEAAELVIAAPVDEMIHAVLAQFTLATQIAARTGVPIVHMTDRERFTFDAAKGEGAYTVDCYLAAGWGLPNARYWIGGAEAHRRLAELNDRYESIGVYDLGRRHTINFDRPETAELAEVG